MPPRRRIPSDEGWAAVSVWRSAPDEVSREVVATAVRFTVEEVAEAAPGNSVELRVPPFAAAQLIAGVRHRRGTPPAVIQVGPAEWLALVIGDLTWDDAVATGRVQASGERADLSALLPLAEPAMPTIS